LPGVRITTCITIIPFEAKVALSHIIFRATTDQHRAIADIKKQTKATSAFILRYLLDEALDKFSYPKFLKAHKAFLKERETYVRSDTSKK
jgi:hypothetical protein